MSPRELDQIAKLVTMLGSDVDAEVLAAVVQIRKFFRFRGMDLHWLADLVRGHSGLPTGKPRVVTNVEGMIDEVLGYSDEEMSTVEENFVRGLKTRLKLRGYLNLSQKQTDWLVDIHRRVTGGRVA